MPVAQADYAVLEATASIENPEEVEVDVISGALACDKCHVYYPVHNGIPRMLIYPTEVARIHAQENASWINKHLTSFRLPQSAPPPGEMAVLRNFSTEWTGYKWTGDSYWNMTPETMLRAQLYELGVPRYDLKHRLVLEVGIGLGGMLMLYHGPKIAK